MPRRIAYLSQLRSADDPSVVARIVARSRERNAALGITGVLAVENGRVCQVLEGPPSRVERLFEAIAADTRHRDVVVIERCDVAVSRFAGWGMVRWPMADVVALAFPG